MYIHIYNLLHFHNITFNISLSRIAYGELFIAIINVVVLLGYPRIMEDPD